LFTKLTHVKKVKITSKIGVTIVKFARDKGEIPKSTKKVSHKHIPKNGVHRNQAKSNN
jgi:hypothetical protein